MQQGFRKLTDAPQIEIEWVAALEARLKRRGIRHFRQLHKFCGPTHDERRWIVYVYIRDLAIAQDELSRMEPIEHPSAQAKVVAIS